MFEDFSWIKFGICFGLLVILPVWVFDVVPLKLSWRLMYTVAGAFGIWIALEYGSMNPHRK